MVNVPPGFRSCLAVLLLAAAVLTAAAWNRGAEYDEQYTLFLTAGTPRPVWPETAFPAGQARAIQAGHSDPLRIAHDLRTTDVHPPLYFWLLAAWRCVAGDGLFAARLLSVAASLGALAAVGAIAVRANIPPALAMLLTLGCYGFAYTGSIARGFAMAQMLALGGLAGALAGRFLLAGSLLGAAAFTNDLAVFVGLAVVAGEVRRWWGGGGAVAARWNWLSETRNGNVEKRLPLPLREGESLGW